MQDAAQSRCGTAWYPAAAVCFTYVKPRSRLAFAWNEQLPRCMMTALPTKAVGRLKGVQPSAGSALISGSGAEAVELTSAAIDGPKPACMTVYDCPSTPPPCISANYVMGSGQPLTPCSRQQAASTTLCGCTASAVHCMSSLQELHAQPCLQAADNRGCVNDTVYVEIWLVDREGAAILVQ